MKFGRCGLPDLAENWTPEQIMTALDAISELQEQEADEERRPSGAERVSGGEMMGMLTGMN